MSDYQLRIITEIDLGKMQTDDENQDWQKLEDASKN